MSTPSFPNINKPVIQNALAEAAKLEYGIVLNDHYSPDFYTKRRAQFLGRHPSYAHVKNGIFTIACEDADLVFGPYEDDLSEDDLSVEEIRRREIINEVIPFLPLPTTGNTQTIDSYGGLPDSEWEEGKEGSKPASAPYSTPSPPRSPVPPEGTKPLSAEASPNNADQTSQQAQIDEVAVASPSSMETSNSTNMAASDPRGALGAAQAAADPALMARIPSGPSQSYSQDEPEQASTAIMPPQAASTTFSSGPASNTPAIDYTRDTAAAYPHRATTRVVKQRRGTKRSLSESNVQIVEVSDDSEVPYDSAASPEDSSSAFPPKKKLNINVGPKSTASKKDAANPVDGRASSETQETDRRRKLASTAARRYGVPPEKKPAPVASKMPRVPPKKTAVEAIVQSSPTIDDVVSGAALPHTPDQAREAAGLRYTQLRDHYNENRARPVDKPELMPEFFEKSRFPRNQNGGVRQQVRCVCKVRKNDRAPMLACKECGVWQHIGCVGEAKPDNLKKGKYFCHVCDPWAHRRKIQKLRQDKPV